MCFIHHGARMSLLNKEFDRTNGSLHIKINATRLSIERWREETGKLSNKKHDRKRQNQ